MFNDSWENFPIALRMDWWTDKVNYRVALLLKNKKFSFIIKSKYYFFFKYVKYIEHIKEALWKKIWNGMLWHKCMDEKQICITNDNK